MLLQMLIRQTRKCARPSASELKKVEKIRKHPARRVSFSLIVMQEWTRTLLAGVGDREREEAPRRKNSRIAVIIHDLR